MKRVIYLAGKMSGLPDFNYPAFIDAAAKLRAMGHTVLNPAENPVPPCGSWAGYMRLALAQLVQCETIVLLPGWSESKGALLEYKLARILAMDVGHYTPGAVGGFELMEEKAPFEYVRSVANEGATDWAAA